MCRGHCSFPEQEMEVSIENCRRGSLILFRFIPALKIFRDNLIRHRMLSPTIYNYFN